MADSLIANSLAWQLKKVRSKLNCKGRAPVIAVANIIGALHVL